jgi:hypothetical protein
VLNGLALRIENGAFWHHPYVCFHGASITGERRFTKAIWRRTPRGGF